MESTDELKTTHIEKFGTIASKKNVYYKRLYKILPLLHGLFKCLLVSLSHASEDGRNLLK